MPKDPQQFMQKAVELSFQGQRSGAGGPFGAVVVRDGVVVGQGSNRVISTNDPTAHAEVVAIRDACQNLNTHQLTGCELYTSCEPCPMCLGAIYWARPDRVYFA
ncbi:MAG: nucleoside deaminase, partial [Sphingobacteriaceae bacterium]|nr:nucleoside deaminase [Cytophagaceae bacterium]